MKIKLFTIPNCLTLANLFCGSLAVINTAMMIADPSSGSYMTALILIIVAAVFDFFDGFTARLLKQYSEIGLQLDSLADMVSFGLAPSVILMSLSVRTGGGILMNVATLSVVLCSALRLAKFNIDTTQKESFVGLPTPACALLVASVAYCMSTLAPMPLGPAAIAVISLVLAWLLISPVRMFSLKFHGYALSDPKNVLRYCFLAVSAAIFGFTQLKGIWCIIIIYIITSLFSDCACRCKANGRAKNEA